MLTRWSVKVFCKACTDLKFASNIPADHIDENASQICQICVRDWETGKVIWEIAQPWAPNLMAHKWWNVFRSRWGMKEPIKRPLDSGIGKVSAQRYPSVQQHRGEQSVFICPCHGRQTRRRERRRFDLSNTKTGSRNLLGLWAISNLRTTIRLLQSIHQKSADLRELV